MQGSGQGSGQGTHHNGGHDQSHSSVQLALMLSRQGLELSSTYNHSHNHSHNHGHGHQQYHVLPLPVIPGLGDPPSSYQHNITPLTSPFPLFFPSNLRCLLLIFHIFRTTLLNLLYHSWTDRRSGAAEGGCPVDLGTRQTLFRQIHASG